MPDRRAVPSLARGRRPSAAAFGARSPLLALLLTPVVALLALVSGPAIGVARASGATSPERLRVGSLVLRNCRGDEPGYCGTIDRPLDPTRPSGPQIAVGFRWLPALGGSGSRPTLVAMEGGPGAPSTGSTEDYTEMYGSLLRHRDLLLFDARGTGRSSPIDCGDLQTNVAGRQSGPAFARRVGACGRSLDRRYRDARGRAVHASDLFSTPNAAGDLDALLTALQVRRIDLYGDSYGTYFVQAFVARYRRRLHSVVLDSAYPARDLDPFYASSGVSGRTAIDRVCARDPACAAAPGSASSRLAALLAVVRARPLRGTTRTASGRRVRATVGPEQLADLVQDSGSDALILRELDASVRAALSADPAPLLRLAVQSRAADHAEEAADQFSNGLYWAVACTDYPQLFSMSASPGRRLAEFDRQVDRAPADAFAPFSVREWVAINGYSQSYDGCLDWPRPRRTIPAVPPKAPPLPTSVPLLVLGGDLDSLTPVADAARFAPGIARRSRVVAIDNAVHVPTEGNPVTPDASACARRVLRKFVRAPGRIDRIDASCARRTAPIRTPGAFPRVLADAAAARVVSGPAAGPETVRAVTVAAGALADATARYGYADDPTHSPGLRGGWVTARGESTVRLRLDAVRFVADAPVSGNARWQPDSGTIGGRLTVRTPGGRRVTTTIAWGARDRTARATVGATRLVLPAP